jgi:dihydroorotate dehydrogenase electron transfer subunit
VSHLEPARHGACYADHAWHGRVTIDEQVRLARDTYRVRFACPQIARRIVPGQFVMLRLAGYDDPLLGRPLALYDTVLDSAGRATAIEIVYLVTGKFTGKLARCLPGQELEVWGPLGNGFWLPPAGGFWLPLSSGHLVLVAGGIGQTPFVALAQEALGQRTYGDPPRDMPRAAKVTFCYGVRSREFLAGLADFERLGITVRTSSDDGSAGHHGLVTDLLRQTLADSELPCRVVCCGPERMMEAVAEITRHAGVPCLLSLETPMACGIGICFSCVAKVRQGDGWDYRRTCVEGPVFDAAEIVF